jgi:hypothetical protein
MIMKADKHSVIKCYYVLEQENARKTKTNAVQYNEHDTNVTNKHFFRVFNMLICR